MFRACPALDTAAATTGAHVGTIEVTWPGSPGGAEWQPQLHLQVQRPVRDLRRTPVLYVHGATFAAANCVFFRLEGCAWADALNRAGCEVRGCAFAGYGASERDPAVGAQPRAGGESLLALWCERHLDSDPTRRSRNPVLGRTPNGPLVDIAAAWTGHLAYEPSAIASPWAIIRGAWDSLSTDADAHWLRSAAWRAPDVIDVKIADATHLMQLQQNRHRLRAATPRFLGGTHTVAPTPACAPRGQVTRPSQRTL